MSIVYFLKKIQKVRIWSGVLVRQNNVTIHQNLNSRINILVRDDERECFNAFISQWQRLEDNLTISNEQ